jgi:hypothetical protein
LLIGAVVLPGIPCQRRVTRFKSWIARRILAISLEAAMRCKDNEEGLERLPIINRCKSRSHLLEASRSATNVPSSRLGVNPLPSSPR